MTGTDGTPGRMGTVFRWLTFNAVGGIGIGVQLCVLVTLTEWLNLHYLISTGLAVEVTVLHNFLWHERWTWRDRVRSRSRGRLDRLARFHLVTGTLAIVGNVGLTGLYATALNMHYVLANLLAIASCSLMSFVASDRWVFRPVTRLPRRRGVGLTGVVLWVLIVTSTGPADAAELKSQTVEAWSVYIQATEQRIEGELLSADRFLVQDFHDEAEKARVALRRGDVVVRKMKTRESGDSIDVPKGAIHHWRGSVLIPGVTLEDVLEGVTSPLRQQDLQEDVIESRVLERDDDRMKVFLKLRRTKVVTVHYNTEHVMQYARHDANRASSRSVATRIAELKDAGTSRELEKPIGNDRGFLWRLNSYWRYQEVEGGVIVECESVSLSRAIPAVLRWMVAPIIRDAAKESMERTLTSMRTRLVAGVVARSPVDGE